MRTIPPIFMRPGASLAIRSIPLVIFFSSAISALAVPGFEELLPPFIQKNCIACHGPDKQKGKLRLDTLPPDFKDPRVVEKWEEVITSISNHDMPPEDEPQPSTEEIASVAEFLEARLAEAEIAERSTRVVLRRMNRTEYNNTIRDLVGVDFDPADVFPADPPAGGFDNIGSALSISPMQLELYYSAAVKILDRALVDTPQPATIKWRFDPEEDKGTGDRNTVERGENKHVIVNKGPNTSKGDFTIINLDRVDMNIRRFNVPTEGEYRISVRAAGNVPPRAEVVAAAAKLQGELRDKKNAKNPDGREWAEKEYQDIIKHFETSWYYDYGPPRLKVIKDLGGTPTTVDEIDISGGFKPETYEFTTHMTTKEAGFKFQNTYSVPQDLENFQFLRNPEFARPELAIDYVEIEGPMHPVWPPGSHSAILFDSPLKDTDEIAYAREVLTRFMTKAYRRPLRDGEVAARMALFEKIRPDKASFVEAIKVPLAATLASSNFLYLVEPGAPAAEPRKLVPFELASRLSYFLWSSMPDAELFALAKSGKITEPATIRSQVTRMLADPRSQSLVKNFAGQWLGLRKVGDNPPSTTLYPEYDRHLELSIVRETEGFFEEVLRKDLDIRNLIKSDFLTINERLARFYGIPGVRGDDIRRVPVPADSPRGGLVTQASIHSITSNGTRTSPVVRGVWVMKTLLGTDPGLPVANVGEIQPNVPGIDKATVRQRLAIHREIPSCARCHNDIDPLGLALENFDASGRWREREGHGYNGRIGDNDPPIDASAKMPDGTEFVGVRGLQEQLLEKDGLFSNSLATQLTTYAIGRELGFSDKAAIRSFTTNMKKNGNTIRSLISEIATSDLFTTK